VATRQDLIALSVFLINNYLVGKYLNKDLQAAILASHPTRPSQEHP